MKTLIYLATPYTHEDPSVMAARFDAVNRVAAELMRHGLHIFSPISHTHPIALAGGLPRGWDYWREYDYAILRACARMVVLMQDGWRESRGIAGEIVIAKKLGIPVEYMTISMHTMRVPPADSN